MEVPLLYINFKLEILDTKAKIFDKLTYDTAFKIYNCNCITCIFKNYQLMFFCQCCLKLVAMYKDRYSKV